METHTRFLPHSPSPPWHSLGLLRSISKKASPPYKVSLATWPFLGPTAHLPCVLLSVVLEICFSILHTEEKPGGPSVLFLSPALCLLQQELGLGFPFLRDNPLLLLSWAPGSLPPASCPPRPFLKPSTPLTPRCCTSPEASLVAPNLRTSLLSPCSPGSGCRPSGWRGSPWI